MGKNAKQVNINKATLYTIASALSLSIMICFVKMVTPYVNNCTVVFFRFAVGLLYLLVIFGVNKYRGKAIPYRTNHIGWQILRAAAGFGAVVCFYYALKFIPLIDGNLLYMTNPLFIPILTAIFIRKGATKGHWVALAVGFIGIILVMKPGHELFQPASFVGLLSGLFTAVAFIALRKASSYDNTHTTLFYYFLFSFFASGLLMFYNWSTPTLYATILLFAIGIFGTLFQAFLTYAAKYAPAKITASLLYSSVIFSGILGWLVWGSVPDWLTISGSVLVCTSSVLIVLIANSHSARETVTTREEAAISLNTEER